MLERLMNQGNAPLLEQWLRFTEERHKLIADNVVNLSTPNYQQKDLSPEKFQAALRDRIESRNAAGGTAFDDLGDLSTEANHGMLFHDGANRSAEQLMSDQAKNAMTHNLIIELLRKQFSAMEMAIKERPT